MLGIEIALWLTQRQSWCILFSCISCLSSFFTTHSGTMGEWEVDGSVIRGYSKQGRNELFSPNIAWPGPVTKDEQRTIWGQKTKSHVQHCTGCKGRTTGCGVLSFLPFCITPTHFLSSALQVSLCMHVCVYRHIYVHVYKGNYMQDVSRQANCLISSMLATLQLRLAAPKLD